MRFIVGLVFVYILFPLFLYAQSDSAEMREWIDASLYRDMHIVIPENASPILQHSAEVFKKYWELCTHRPITISTINQGIVNVWLGAELCTKEWIQPEELEELGDEGFIIRTYTPTRKYAQKGVAKQLLICGKTDTGTLHGVYTFFERYLNVAWLSRYYIHTPPLGYRLKEMDYKFLPHFEFRVFLSDLPEFKMEGDRKEGLHLSLLPSEKDLMPIPIYEVLNEDGTKQNTEEIGISFSTSEKPICLSNESNTQILIDFFKRQMESSLEKTFWNLDVKSSGNICTCENCQKLLQNAETPSSPLLLILNNVVEELEKIYPEKDFHFIITLHSEMRQAPKNINLHDRIFIALSTDTCDSAYPLDDPSSITNACFFADLKNWGNITRNILIEYATGSNYYCGLSPLVELFNFQRNIQLFDRYQARGIIIRTPSVRVFPFSEFDSLKSYILARLMWDPDIIIEDEIKQFLNIFYGPAGDKFGEFLEYQKDFIRTNNIHCNPYQKVPWWNGEYASKAEQLIKQTINMTYFSQDIYNRVLQSIIPLYYLSLNGIPDVKIQGETFTEIRPNTIEETEFWNKLDSLERSIKTVEFTPYRKFVPSVFCYEKFPDRLFTSRFYTLENEFYTLWVLDKKGAIIRIQDKNTGLEFLSGFQKGTNPNFVWNEYQDISEIGCGKPFDSEYVVIEKNNSEIVMERKIKKDIFLRRKISLGDNQKIVLDYQCENRNIQEEKVSLFLISAFTLFDNIQTLEIWSYSQQDWKKIKQIPLPYQPFTYLPEYVQEKDITGIGFSYNDKKLSLQIQISQLPPDTLQFLYDYSYYDRYISPMLKLSFVIPSQNSISFTLYFQTSK